MLTHTSKLWVAGTLTAAVIGGAGAAASPALAHGARRAGLRAAVQRGGGQANPSLAGFTGSDGRGVGSVGTSFKIPASITCDGPGTVEFGIEFGDTGSFLASDSALVQVGVQVDCTSGAPVTTLVDSIGAQQGTQPVSSGDQVALRAWEANNGAINSEGDDRTNGVVVGEGSPASPPQSYGVGVIDYSGSMPRFSAVTFRDVQVDGSLLGLLSGHERVDIATDSGTLLTRTSGFAENAPQTFTIQRRAAG